MDLQLKLNDAKKIATVAFASSESFGFLAQWRESLNPDQHEHPFRADSVEFADLARHRYEAHSKVQPYVRAVSDYAGYIGNNPHCEVACMALLKCDWFPNSEVLGLVHFRRTWCNHIVLDYLCAHPFISKPPEGCTHIVKGVGTALLYFIVQVAKACNAELIWGEATPNSCDFYKGVFKLKSVKDLIYVPKEDFEKFASRLETGWRGADKAISEPVLEEIYTIESGNPPFVGSKTAVFSPIQLLTRHLIELNLPQRMAVAKALGVVDLAGSDFEFCSRIIQKATSAGQIDRLWTEVETAHPNGHPEPNPFSH